MNIIKKFAFGSALSQSSRNFRSAGVYLRFFNYLFCFGDFFNSVLVFQVKNGFEFVIYWYFEEKKKKKK